VAHSAPRPSLAIKPAGWLAKAQQQRARSSQLEQQPRQPAEVADSPTPPLPVQPYAQQAEAPRSQWSRRLPQLDTNLDTPSGAISDVPHSVHSTAQQQIEAARREQQQPQARSPKPRRQDQRSPKPKQQDQHSPKPAHAKKPSVAAVGDRDKPRAGRGDKKPSSTALRIDAPSPTSDAPPSPSPEMASPAPEAASPQPVPASSAAEFIASNGRIRPEQSEQAVKPRPKRSPRGEQKEQQVRVRARVQPRSRTAARCV
jgi:hypothetical protein